MKVVLCDIDGVLAEENVNSLLTICNQTLKLHIPDEQLVNISVRAFHKLPQVREYCQRVSDEKYERQFQLLGWHPHHIARLDVVEGAVDAVNSLLEVADDLGYCTARVIDFHAEWNADLARMTHFWLENSKFPHHKQVIFCDKYIGKIAAIAKLLRESPQLEIVLIDDNATILLQFFDQLQDLDQEALKRGLTLVGFGFFEECEDMDMPIRVLSLENWERPNVKRFIEKEFEHGRQK